MTRKEAEERCCEFQGVEEAMTSQNLKQHDIRGTVTWFVVESDS